MSRIIPYVAAGLTKVATTGANGFALQNGTSTILSWTAPDDGNLHSVILCGKLNVTAVMTGGATEFLLNGVGLNMSNRTSTTQFFGGGGFGVGDFGPFQVTLEPGDTIGIAQSSALTAGAATVYAEIWAS